jgi:nucleotide-binding universal stress UspA family protein
VASTTGVSCRPCEHGGGVGSSHRGGQSTEKPYRVGHRLGTDDFHEQAEATGTELVADVADRLASVDTETVVRGGVPHEIILEEAGDGADRETGEECGPPPAI